MPLFSRRRQVDNEAHLELVSQIHGLLQRVKALEDDLAALEAKYERLRGRFYATRGADTPPTPLSKGAVLRAAGYVPGKPIPTE
jgi:hypothetical protein